MLRFCVVILLCSSLTFASASTNPQAPTNHARAQLAFPRTRPTFKVASRMQQPLPACGTFHISYQDVRRTYVTLESAAAAIVAHEQQCKQNCPLDGFDACWDGCERALTDAYSAELALHEYGPAVVSVLMLGLGDALQLHCTPLFKDSTVGNCYVHEYLLLNGKTESGVSFDKERATSSDGKYLQCRANALANDGDRANQYECRRVFRTSRARVAPIEAFMLPYVRNAAAVLAQCQAAIPPLAGGLFDGARLSLQYARCARQFEYNVQLAYGQCVLHFDANNCHVHAFASGVRPLLCPALRRESTIDACSVVDYVALHQLRAFATDDSGRELSLIPNACSSYTWTRGGDAVLPLR